MIYIVQEAYQHIAQRETLLDRAFGASRFAKTCERLREGRLPAEGLAFSMLERDELVGTVRLWNVSLGQSHNALMLGPVAIAASHQGEGLGGRLIHHAMDAAATRGHGAILLVGDAPYYARFGFAADLVANLWMPGPVEHGRFLGRELVEGALAGASGFVLGSGASAPRPELRDLMSAAIAA